MRNVLLVSTCIAALSAWAAVGTSQPSQAQDAGTAPRGAQSSGDEGGMDSGGMRTSPSDTMRQTAPRTKSESSADMQQNGGGTGESGQPDTLKKRQVPKSSAQGSGEFKDTGKPGGRDAALDRNGPAAGGDRWKLDDKQASDLRNRLGRQHDATTTVNFSARVGVAVPQSVRLRELPPDIVATYPRFRGYDFVMIGDEIVIIDPRSRQVVQVVGGPSTGSIGPRSAPRHFSREQDQLIRKNVHVDRAATVDFDERTEERVPDTVVLQPLPDTVVTEIPDTRSYRYFVDRDDHIVVVDPESHEVVDVLE